MSIYSTPDSANYGIGKGKIEIALITGGTIGSYVNVGNAPSFSFEPTEEAKEHYESQTAAAALDEEAITKTGYNLNFELDELAVNNFKMFMKASGSGPVLYGNMELQARYAVRFTSDNSKGPNYKIDFWKTKLTPKGEVNLIGEDWMKLGFTGKGFKDATNHAESPFYTMTYITTTTTTTTAP